MKVYSQLQKSSDSWLILRNYVFSRYIFVKNEKIYNFKIDKNFSHAVITYIIISKYFFKVNWLLKSDYLFIKINIYLSTKVI